MAKIDIVPKDALNVAVKANALVEGQKYPLQVTLKHDYKRGIVLPRAGHAETILADTDTVLTVNSFDQVWELCSDLAHLAAHHNREKFCSLVVAEPPVSTEEEAPAPDTSAEQPKGAGKPTKVKEAQA